jgi:hypothetical protein
MKNIQVSDEVYDKLMSIANDMTTQDPRGTRGPHIFVIREFVKDYDWGLNGDERCLVDSDGDYFSIEKFDDFLEYLDDRSVEYDKETAREMWEDFSYDLDEFIEENKLSLSRITYNWVPKDHNAFFTERACEDHIKSNHYHYNKPMSYLKHGWRNPEMETIQEFLCGLVGKRMHT